MTKIQKEYLDNATIFHLTWLIAENIATTKVQKIYLHFRHTLIDVSYIIGHITMQTFSNSACKMGQNDI